MYKHAGKFLNGLSGGARRGRFGGGLATSAQIGRQDRHAYACKPRWLDLIHRLDAEVARVTPSLQKKVAVQYTPKPRMKRARPEGQRVYLVLFQLRSDPRVSFLKVGISAYDIRARFRSDLGLYKVSLLAESARFLGRDAETAEHAIHRAFHKSRVWPSVRLMSGNSECFAHTEANLRQFVDIVNAI